MERLKEMIKWQMVTGQPVAVGGVILTPQSQALTVRWPNGGLVWNRPVAILIERDQHTERIPIVDVTRMVQVGLLGFGLAFGIMAFVQTVLHRRAFNG